MKTEKFMKTPRCSKGGVKIHDSENQPTGYDDDQLAFYNKIKNEQKHTGVRIAKTDNNYTADPFGGIDPFKNPEGEKEVTVKKVDNIMDIDLNINNYSQKELYKLFGIQNNTALTKDIMKICKKTVLKTHPDKSGIDRKYFLFFSQAYKRIFSIYEFQNKADSGEIKVQVNDQFDSNQQQQAAALNHLFENNKSLKKTTNFNEWFNEQFDKHQVEDDTQNGYGDWLQSDENVENIDKISESNLSSEIEKRKKQQQSVTEYKGISTQYFSAFGGTSLIQHNNDFNSSSLFSGDGMGYTDLKQAYAESLIPVTEEDYNKIPKFKTVDEYNRYRSSQDIAIPDKEQSMKQLYKMNEKDDEESRALAFHLAKQSEQVEKNSQSFWSNIKQLKN
jgi:curved DNA-binding protein CbpA